MKKIIYLCTLIILELNVVAQIDLNDWNWEMVFFDDFSNDGRSWDYYWKSNPDKKWQAYIVDSQLIDYENIDKRISQNV